MSDKPLFTVQMEIDESMIEIRSFVSTDTSPEFQDLLAKTTRRMIDTQDEAIRQALIKMGWTPPRVTAVIWHEHRPGESWCYIDKYGEILAWINKPSRTGLTYKWGDRSFTSLEAAQAAVEWSMDPANQINNSLWGISGPTTIRPRP